MARKRIDKKFAITAAAVAGVVLVLAVGAYVAFRPRESAAKYLALAETDRANRDFAKAYADFSRATQLSPKSPAMQVQLAEYARAASGANPGMIGEERKALEAALELDPKNVAANRRLLDWWSQYARSIQSTPDAFKHIRDYADAVANADPKDTEAPALLHSSWVQGWLAKVDTQQETLDREIKILAEIVAKGPAGTDARAQSFHADLAMTLAQAHIRQASDAATAGKLDDFKARVAEAEQVLDDAIKANPDDLPLLYRAMSTYRQLRAGDPKNTGHADRFAATLKQAQTLAKPDAPLYVDINMVAAQELIQKGDRAGAQAIFTTLSDQRPNAQAIRLAYAKFLAMDPQTRPKAIELLSKPIDRSGGADTSSSLNVASQMLGMEYETRKLGAEWKVDATFAEKEPETKLRQARAVEPEVDRLARDYAKSPEPMVLKGRLEMLQGQTVSAVTTMGRAKALLDSQYAQRGNRNSDEYYALMMRMGEAYLQMKQYATARDTFKAVLNTAPMSLQARFFLIQTLLAESSVPEARVEAREFRRIASASTVPLDKSSKQLLDYLDLLLPAEGSGTGSSPSTAKEKQIEQLQNLAVVTHADKVRKGQAALMMGEFAIAISVLGDAVAEEPKDADASKLYIQALESDGKMDDAKAALESAIKVNPDEVTLLIERAKLNKASKDDVEKILRESLKGKDEFGREIGEYDIAQAKGDRDAARKHLDAARKLKPDDKRVLDQSFVMAVGDKDFAAAEAMLPALTAGNVDQAKGNLYRFELARVRGDLPEATRIAKQMTLDLPEFLVSWLSLARAYQAQGNFTDAYDTYIQAIQRKQNDPDSLRGAIQSALALRRIDDAQRILDDATQRLPRDPSFMELRRTIDLTYGDPGPVVRETEERLKGRETDPVVQAQLARMYGQAMTGRQRAGDTAGAKMYATKSLEAFGRLQDNLPPAAPVQDQLQLMATIAEMAGRAGDPGAGEARLRRFVDSDALKGRWEPRMVLSEYYAATGRPADAVREAQQTLSTAGAAVEPRVAVARILAPNGKLEEALAALDGAQGAAGNVELQKLKLDMVVNAQRFDQAEKLVRERLSKTPGDLSLQNLLTNIYINTARYLDATKQVAQTLAADRNDLVATYYRGLIQLKSPNGDLESAVQDFQTVRDSGRQVPTEMRLALWEALERLGRHDSAMHEIEAILLGEPGNKPVRLTYFNALLKDKNFGAALKVADDGLTVPELTNDSDLIMAKARLKAVQGDADNAIVLVREAVNHGNGNPGFYKTYLEMLLAANRAKVVLTETESMIKPGQSVPIWLLVDRATAHKQLGDAASAATDFGAALQAASTAKSEEAALAVAVDMARVLGPEDALKVALERSKENLNWRILVAYLYQSQSKLDKALAVLEPDLAIADKLTPTEQVQLLTPAGLYLVSPGPQQNFDRAADVYRKLVRLQPDEIPALNNLAFIISEKVKNPNLGEALAYSQHAYDLLQKSGNVSPLIYDTHGWLLVQNRQYSAGIQILNQALDRQDFIEGRYHLGVADTLAGYLDEGKRELERARELSEQSTADPSYKPKVIEALAQNEAARAAKASGKK